jgi:hypothetical protein
MASEKTTISQLHITLHGTLAPEEREHIHEQIVTFNDRTSRHHRDIHPVGTRPLDILVRDSQRRIVGGLIASTYWG